MGIYDLMQSYRGAALNIRHINLRHDAAALGGKANFRKCIERIQKDGGNSDNIFITDAVYNNIVYIEQENGVYIEIFPLSLDMIEFIRFKDRLEWLPDCSAHLKVAGSDVRTPQYMTSRGLSMHN